MARSIQRKKEVMGELHEHVMKVSGSELQSRSNTSVEIRGWLGYKHYVLVVGVLKNGVGAHNAVSQRLYLASVLCFFVAAIAKFWVPHMHTFVARA